MQTIEAGAAESGRSLDDIHIVLWTPTAIDDDRTKARDLVRAHVSRVAIRPLPGQGGARSGEGHRPDPRLLRLLPAHESRGLARRPGARRAGGPVCAGRDTRTNARSVSRRSKPLVSTRFRSCRSCAPGRAGRPPFVPSRTSSTAVAERPVGEFPAPGSAVPGAPPPLNRNLTAADGISVAAAEGGEPALAGTVPPAVPRRFEDEVHHGGGADRGGGRPRAVPVLDEWRRSRIDHNGRTKMLT